MSRYHNISGTGLDRAHRGFRRVLLWALLTMWVPLYGGGLDLPSIFDRIEQENFTVLVNREGVEAAFQNSQGRGSFLYPRLDGNVRQVRQRTPGSFGAPIQPDDPESFGGRSGSTFNRFDASLSLSYQPLDPNLIADYRLAQLGHRIAQLSYETILRQIQTEAARLYFLHLRNLKRLDVINANLERDRSLLELAKNQLAVGVATQIDVTRAESRLATDQIDYLQQQLVIRESERALRRLLNWPEEDTLELSAWPEPEPKQSEVTPTPIGLLLENRFDYRVEQEELSQARLTRRAADWQRFPTVRLFADYGFASETAFDGREQNTWLAGVQLTVPIFEGFRIRSDQLRADANLRSREYILQDKENEIRTEYHLASTEITTRYEQIELARKQVELGMQELQLARNRFEQGVADNREVIDAQAGLAAANDSLVEAVFLFNLSRLNYAFVRGNPRLLLRE